MALDKTLTIKRRKVDVYLPTFADRLRWKAEAKKAGLSVSRWVWTLVEAALTKAPRTSNPEEASP